MQTIVAKTGERLLLSSVNGRPYSHVVIFSFPALPATHLWPAEPAKRVAKTAASYAEAVAMAKKRKKSCRLDGVDIIAL